MWAAGYLVGGQPDALPIQVDIVSADELAGPVELNDAPKSDDGDEASEPSESQELDQPSTSLASSPEIPSAEQEAFAVLADESLGTAQLVAQAARFPTPPPMRSSPKSSVADSNRVARQDAETGEVRQTGLVMPQRVVERPSVRVQRVNYRQVEPHYGWLADMLKRQLEKMKRYPPAARSRGWQGNVVVQAAVNVSGRVHGLDVVRSSGHKILDEDAMDLLRQVSPLELRYPIHDEEVTVEVINDRRMRV